MSIFDQFLKPEPSWDPRHPDCGPGAPIHLVATFLHPPGLLLLRHAWPGYRIIGANSHLEFTDELLNNALLPEDERLYGGAITVTLPDDKSRCREHTRGLPWVTPWKGPCFHDAIVKVSGVDQEYIYKVSKYNIERHVWRASWPD